MIGSVSFFFYAGDFVAALDRYDRGLPQQYATHDEVSRLLRELSGQGLKINVHSFMGNKPSIEAVDENLRFINLGAKHWNDNSLLTAAVRSANSDAFVPHFANPHLIRACLATKRPTLAMTASSSNRPGLYQRYERYRLGKLLKDSRLSLVSNHCLPATSQLHSFGVPAEKLVPWDVPHRISPADFAPKGFPSDEVKTLAYAGTVSVDKGVADIVSAVAHVRDVGGQVRARIAGSGAIAEMRALADKVGVQDRVEFLGLIENDKVLQLFRDADAICIPSRHTFGEGFPLTMFEAIASRTPIVCSDHPMFMPVMIHEERAMVFKDGDAQALGRSLQRLTSEPDLYEKLSRNATASWAYLSRSADWRTLIKSWLFEGPDSDWIKRHTLRAFLSDP